MVRLLLAMILLLAAGAGPVFAADATDAAVAGKGDKNGMAADPHGAIRAMGGSGQPDYSKDPRPVTVPDVGADVPNSRGGPPPGTTGGR